jgi:hypothetical protein
VVTVGFAAGNGGEGVAYAALRAANGRESIVRVGFRCRPLAALRGRDIAYAALAAVAEDLLRRDLRDVAFRIDDSELPVDLAARRALPAALTVAYVALRCKLNRFRAATVAFADGAARDVTARARAEVSLNVAA